MTQEFGEIEKIEVEQVSYKKTQIKWRIQDFLSVVENRKNALCVDSPYFSTADDSSLYFRLYLDMPPYMILYLKCVVGFKYAAEYKFGFKRSDGNMLNFVPGILKRCTCYSDATRTIKLSELLSRKSELVPGNVLTVTCTLRRDISHPIQPVALEGKKTLKLINLDKLSQNFQGLFDNKESCDTILKVKEKDYKAHRAVLMARSPIFAATFKHDTSERQTGIITIPDCDPDSFQEFLQYIYCGKLELSSIERVSSLYVTSDKYDVQELKEYCVQYLTQCLTVENVCDVVVLADKYEEEQLLSAVQDFFKKNGFKIFLTSQWEQLLKKNYRLANKLLTEFSKSKLKE